MRTKNSVVANQYGSALNISSPMVAQLGFGAAVISLKDAFNDGITAQVSPFNVSDKFFKGRMRETAMPDNQQQVRFNPETTSISSRSQNVTKIPKQKKIRGHVSAPAYLNNTQIPNVAKAANIIVFVISGMICHSFQQKGHVWNVWRGVLVFATHLISDNLSQLKVLKESECF